MVVNDPSAARGVSRRGFLSLAGAAAGLPLIASCSGGGSGGSGGAGGGGDVIKFWDMPWGSTQYNVVAKKLVTGYKPAGGLPSASYQLIQWANFTQTFSSAIASKTGPAVSSGGGFQAFQFAEQGAIHYADAVVAAFKKDGTYDDFLPGLLDPFKTDKGYAAVPWQQDVRVYWMNKALLDQAGAKAPTTWDEWMTAAAALKKIGVYGFAAGSGAGNNLANQAMVALMINNGGGLWDEDGKLDCTFDRNVEAIDFVLQMVKEGYADPASVSYTGDNQNTQWKDKKFGLGVDTGGLDNNIGDSSGDMQVLSPPTGPHGDKGALVYINNIMMYTESPSQKGSEAFMEYYFKNMKAYWQQPLGVGLPTLKSIVNLPEFQSKPNSVKIVNEYQPIFKTLAARGTTLNANLARIDSSAPLFQFAQTVLGGKTDAKSALSTLQTALQALVK